jgi:hypothetical protein
MKYLIFLFTFMYCSYAQVGQNRNITPAGNFYKWDVLPNDQYGLQWGNRILTRSFPKTFNSDEAFAPFISENSQVIILMGGCGRYCSYGLVLPFDTTFKPLRYDQPYDFNINKNLVAYPYEDDTQSDTGLVVENFITGERHFFIAENCRYFAFNLASQSIYKAQFEGDSLHYNSQYLQKDPNYPSGKPIFMSRTVSVKFPLK